MDTFKLPCVFAYIQPKSLILKLNGSAVNGSNQEAQTNFLNIFCAYWAFTGIE